jgi:O-antigen ligase
MVMAYYFLRNSESRSIRFLAVASFIFSGIMLLISGSRGAFLFFIPIALYQIIYDQKRGRLIGGVIILIVAIIAMNFLPAEYLDRMVQIPTALENTNDTIRLRLNVWDVAIRLWSQNPIFGIGPGMFYYYTNQDFGLLGRSGLATHNMYITFLTENGIIGLAVYLCVVLISITLFFKTILVVKRFNPSWVALVVAWQSAFFIQLLNGTKANSGHDKIQWLCLGVSLVLWHLAQEYAKSQKLPALE